MINSLKKELLKKAEVYLRIKVIPGAIKTEIKEKMADDTWKISIAAKPEKGAANKTLQTFLAKELSLSKHQIKIISGLTDRLKLIKISDKS